MRLPCPNLHPGGGYMTRSQAVSWFRITSRCSHADAAEPWFEENDPEGVV
jgi:hypothetical protein